MRSAGILIVASEGGCFFMIGNPKCLSPNHIFHLCALRDCGLNDKNSETFFGLHCNPKFECEACGETSDKAENLCFPQKLQKDKE